MSTLVDLANEVSWTMLPVEVPVNTSILAMLEVISERNKVPIGLCIGAIVQSSLEAEMLAAQRLARMNTDATIN